MKTKLGLSWKELFEIPWIELNLMMHDFPWYDYSAKKKIKVTSKEQADAILGKYIKK